VLGRQALRKRERASRAKEDESGRKRGRVRERES
jgi:hypothetical protein